VTNSQFVDSIGGKCYKFVEQGGCVSGHNMESFENISRRECQNRCKDTLGCLGIEYFQKSYADNAEDVYKPKDCNLSDSIDTHDCDADRW